MVTRTTPAPRYTTSRSRSSPPTGPNGFLDGRSVTYAFSRLLPELPKRATTSTLRPNPAAASGPPSSGSQLQRSIHLRYDSDTATFRSADPTKAQGHRRSFPCAPGNNQPQSALVEGASPSPG